MRKTIAILLTLMTLLAAGCGVFVWRGARGKIAPESEQLHCVRIGFVPAAATALLIVYASADKLASILRMHPLSHFFMNREQLFVLGFENGAFRLDAVTALAGFAAAVWFALWSVPFLRGKTGVRAMPWFALVSVLWYCLRAINAFVGEPLNSSDSVEIIALFACIALAFVWFRIARWTTFSATAQGTQQILFAAYAAAVIVLAWQLPDVVIYVRRGAFNDAYYCIADLFSALAALALSRMVADQAKESTKNVQ